MYSPRPFTVPDAIAFLKALRRMYREDIIVHVGRDGRNGVVLWRFPAESRHGQFKRAKSMAEFYWQEEARCTG